MYRLSLLIITILIFVYFLSRLPTNNPVVIFCDVGQGDMTLIQFGYHQLVIDLGESGQGLGCLRRHMPIFDNSIEFLLISHFQSDHVGSLSEVLANYDVLRAFYPSDISNNEDAVAMYHSSIELFEYNHVSHQSICQGFSISHSYLGVFNLLWPPCQVGTESTSADPNATSLVISHLIDSYQFLYPADIGTQEELSLISSGLLSQHQVLKVPHHGSKYSSTSKFINHILPDLAIVSAGKSNRHGHPHPETIARYEASSVELLNTANRGDIILYLDSGQIRID